MAHLWTDRFRAMGGIVAVDSQTVFVLGAGFTKAFLRDAPLLTDDYGGEQLRQQFSGFPQALSLLQMEMTYPDHPPGQINLERLMTRLAGGMPYDFRTNAEKSLASLLFELKRAFLNRLDSAKSKGTSFPGELWLFAGHCVLQRVNCVTFNYDDVPDKALWQFNPVWYAPTSWSPDWGYGFPCRMSEAAVRDTETGFGESGPMTLLKLHGSVNWRVPLGHATPYSAEAIRHHEPWFEHYGPGKISLDAIEPFLEPEPLMVPPVLTKTEIQGQPILRLIWSMAVEVLRRAKRVVFLGYSLPLTDIAAAFLFREGLAHLDGQAAVTVVDFARDDGERDSKLPGLLAAYHKVFPTITRDQFSFAGAIEWIRTNLIEWLFDSHGNPIAARALSHVVARNGEYIGSVRGYEGRWEVWHMQYKGEIVHGNRLISSENPPRDDRGGSKPPEFPKLPPVPGSISPIPLPAGYRDIEM